MEYLLKNLAEDIRQLRIDVNIIKGKFDEGELTDWAREELEKARDEPEEEYIDLGDLKEEIEKDLSD